MINASQLNNNVYSNLITDTNKKLILDVYSRIKDANKNNLNKILYELPYYFENLLEIIEKKSLSIDNLRIIIWGNIIENLKQNGYTVSIDVQKKEEKCYIFVKWPTSLDKYTDQIDKYNTLINNCMCDTHE
jgi:hypothetical protein